MEIGWQKRKSAYLPTGDLNVVKSSGARATFRCPPLPCPLDMCNAAFEKVSESWTASASCIEVVCQAILLKLIVPFAVICCSLREIKSLQLRLSYKPNCRLGKICFVSSLSPIYPLQHTNCFVFVVAILGQLSTIISHWIGSQHYYTHH